MNKLIALLAFATIAGFLGILAYRVPELDLVLVVCLTLLLVAIDFFRTAFKKKD